MTRKQRRQEARPVPPVRKPVLPERKPTSPGAGPQPQDAAPLPAWRSRTLAGRAAARAEVVDESQYKDVRRDLLRIGLLALSLFSALVVLRILTSILGLLP